MTHDTLLLLALGSFLPNNIATWLFKKLRRFFSVNKPKFKPIRPYRYYIKFQSDPATQYSYHRHMVIFWLWNFLPMNVLVGVDIYATLHNDSKVALLMTAILLAVNTNYSLYANFDTETGDAHGAYASLRADEIKNDQATDTEELVGGNINVTAEEVI